MWLENGCEWKGFDAALQRFPALGISFRNRIDVGLEGPGNHDAIVVNLVKAVGPASDTDLGPYF